MSIETDAIFERALCDALRDGIKAKMTGYNSALSSLINDLITEKTGAIKAMFQSAISSAVCDPEFVAEIKAAVRTTLAKTLVQKFGGELEKQVNALKSDPTTRARITIAIEDIVAGK